MELWTPDQVAVNDTSNALIEDTEELARRVDDHRPLPEQVVRRIDEELLGERVYSSNAIEGNTLDLRETVMILKQGIRGVERIREAQEAQNLGEAARRISSWVDQKVSVHITDRLLEVHQLILKDINDEWAGRFRGKSVMIHGAKHQPPDYSLIPALVDRALEHLQQKSEINVIVRAAWIHWAIARIHPFYDGNGRVARLWQDLVLLGGNLTCSIIRPADRRNYLDALGSADDGDLNPLIQLVAQRVSATFDKYVTELEREKESDQWIRELAGEVDARAQQKSKLAYAKWARKMEQLRREFENCAARLSKASKTIRLQVRPYPLIDQVSWENIRLGIGAKQTWFFILDFASGATRCQYCFFFGKHFRTDLDTESEMAEERTCLLISELDAGDTFTRLDQVEACPLRLREVFVVEDEFVCRRVDVHGGEAFERGMSALRIAQEFIRDVVLHWLG